MKNLAINSAMIVVGLTILFLFVAVISTDPGTGSVGTIKAVVSLVKFVGCLLLVGGVVVSGLLLVIRGLVGITDRDI